MKTFKILMPFLLAAFALVGCDTDDLRNDIDELKNRVESLEVIVSGLNDNVNALRAFIDGNKTIKSFEKTADGYKIVLSDGEELNIVQGSAGQVKTPEITIGDDGCWVIGNENTGVKAVGDNAPMPKFSIDTENYWTVDFGEGPVRVKGADGNPVKATTNESVGISDAFFEKVEIDNDKMVLTFKDGEKYSLPIVKNLTCRIETDGVEGFKNGVLTVPFGETVHLTVNVSGDNFAVTAPAGWTAVLGEPVEGNAELSLTAPAAEVSPLSRAVADNTRDLTLQVNKGVNWAVDKIQVEAKEVIKSYYNEYNSGKNIVIGEGENSIIVNSTTYPGAQFVESDKEITEDGVFFVKEGIKVTFKKGALKNNILIGDNPNVKAEVALSSYLPLKGEGYGFAAKNISFTGTEKMSYIAQTAEAINYQFLCIDNCSLQLPTAGKNFVNITSGATINNIIIVNSKFFMEPAAYVASRILNVAKGTLASDGVYVKNNVFYSKTESQAINGTVFYASGKDVDCPVTIMNNTFVNFLTNSQPLIKGVLKRDVVAANNIFWTNTSVGKPYSTALVTAEVNSTENIVYDLSGNILFNKGLDNNTLKYFNDPVPEGKANLKVEPESSDPFEGGEFDMVTGVFVPNSNYADYGAKLD